MARETKRATRKEGGGSSLRQALDIAAPAVKDVQPVYQPFLKLHTSWFQLRAEKLRLYSDVPLTEDPEGVLVGERATSRPDDHAHRRYPWLDRGIVCQLQNAGSIFRGVTHGSSGERGRVQSAAGVIRSPRGIPGE